MIKIVVKNRLLGIIFYLSFAISIVIYLFWTIIHHQHKHQSSSTVVFEVIINDSSIIRIPEEVT